MKKLSFLFCLLILCLVVSDLAVAKESVSPCEKTFGRSLTRWLWHDGVNRRCELYLPKGYDSKKKYPLLIVLHGGGGKGRGMRWMTRGRFNLLADRDGFIVAYPDGFRKHWNDGRKVRNTGADEKGFIVALIDRLVKWRGADKTRVYVTGASNGGLMSYRLACDIPEKIAAIAPVMANMYDDMDKKCNSKTPVPVMIIFGDKDPLIPFKGGRGDFFGQYIGDFKSTHQTVRFWVKHNRCGTKPRYDSVPDRDKTDGCKVRIEEFWSEAAAPVVYYHVQGGGHTWPGGRQYRSEKLIGKTCRDFNACDVIWEFLKKFKKK